MAYEDIPPEWLEEFEAAARRPLRTRMRYAFIKTYRPVLDDAPYRIFETMEEYPWLLVFPSLALSATLFSLNFLGDGLRDALDPRASKD